MHVMIIAPEDLPIPAIRGGSVQIYLSQLYEALTERENMKITLVSPGARHTETRTHHCKHIVLPAHGPAYWQKVYALLKKKHPDVVQVDNRPRQALSIYTRFPHVKIVLNLHSLTFLGPRHITHAMARHVLRRVNAVVCNSRALETAIRNRFRLGSNWSAHVIYPGVTQSNADESEPVATQNPNTSLRLLFVGRVIEQKGVHIAIEATKRLQREFPVTLTVVGRTPPWERKYLQSLKRRAKGVNVRFLGFISPSRLHTLYKTHHILLCPSQKHEAFGLVNIEAMYHGLPVVASHIGGIPEALGDQGGTLIREYSSTSAFVSAIRQLRDPEKYEKARENAKHQADSFTWKRSARKFESVYRRC